MDARGRHGVLTANEILEWDQEGTPVPPKPLLVVEGLVKHFPVRSGWFGRASAHVRAVDGLTFTVNDGETLGIVGAAGCGKSTAARLLAHLIKPDRGAIELDGKAVGKAMPIKDYLGQVRMVFSDTNAFLNPRLTIEKSIAFGPTAHGESKVDAVARACKLLDRVGLEPARFAGRYPHELSGDQRQRVNIARALAMQTRILILDDAVAALDKAAAAPVLELLLNLKEEFSLTYVFIDNDRDVVRSMSDRVAVMHAGRIVVTEADSSMASG